MIEKPSLDQTFRDTTRGLAGLACVAGCIVSAREIKFWTSERRSREENGERDSEISESLSPFSSRLRRSLVQNFISRALTIPPATQATRGLTKNSKNFQPLLRQVRQHILSDSSDAVIFRQEILCCLLELSCLILNLLVLRTSDFTLCTKKQSKKHQTSRGQNSYSSSFSFSYPKLSIDKDRKLVANQRFSLKQCSFLQAQKDWFCLTNRFHIAVRRLGNRS